MDRERGKWGGVAQYAVDMTRIMQGRCGMQENGRKTDDKSTMLEVKKKKEYKRAVSNVKR